MWLRKGHVLMCERGGSGCWASLDGGREPQRVHYLPYLSPPLDSSVCLSTLFHHHRAGLSPLLLSWLRGSSGRFLSGIVTSPQAMAQSELAVFTPLPTYLGIYHLLLFGTRGLCGCL